MIFLFSSSSPTLLQRLAFLLFFFIASINLDSYVSFNVQNGKSAINDPFSPFSLHRSDSPDLMLVTQQLTGDNYVSWSRAVMKALSVENKLGFVDGSIPSPDDMDINFLNA